MIQMAFFIFRAEWSLSIVLLHHAILLFSFAKHYANAKLDGRARKSDRLCNLLEFASVRMFD